MRPAHMKPSIFAVLVCALALTGLGLVPATRAADLSYSRITISFMNLTQKQIVIQGALLPRGQWVQGMQPVPQTLYPSNSTVGPFATMSANYGDGNGGMLYTNIGTITWSMGWNQAPTIRIQLNDSTLQAVPSNPNPMPDPDNQHVKYVFTIQKK